MENVSEIIKNIYYVGADDRKIDKFEGLLPLNRGVSYNSYLIKDKKNCLMDTVDQSVSRQFFENIEYLLKGEKLDYLVVLHMEPDHCYNLEQVLLRHPETYVVGNEKTFTFINNFFPNLDLENRKIIVKENDKLDLGNHILNFVFAPMVHWPEVMLAYEEKEKLLFSADAFGMFNSLDGNLFSDNVNFEKDYLDEARRYYTNIVGKYGLQVMSLFKKVEGIDIKMLLPLHGFIWRKDIDYIINKYVKWATYTPEEKGVIIIYGSMYGDNACFANILARKLSSHGVKDIRVFDSSYVSASNLVSESFKYSNIVIVSPTYNMTIYPAIEEYLNDALRMGLRNRTLTLVENGSWAPNAKSLIKSKIENSKLNFNFTKTELTISSSLKNNDKETIDKIVSEIIESLN